MFPTAEVRWFYRGSFPGGVLTWFTAGSPEPEEQPPRVDWYLQIANADALGIKLREGRIELKQRLHQYGIVRLAADVDGRIEGWRKWSFPLAETQEFPEYANLEAQHWIRVRKERRLKKFSITAGGQVEPVPVGSLLSDGCNAELARVSAAGGQWWSLAFEAFGHEPDLLETLVAIAAFALGRGETPAFHSRDSYGYPRLLQIIHERSSDELR
jgi:hypothetical protein